MFRKLLLRGVEGGYLLLILYEIITFNAKKFLITSWFFRKKSWFPDFLDLKSAWQTVSSTDILRFKRVHLVIIVLSPVFTLGVSETSALSVQHPLFPLCVCFEIPIYNPFGVIIILFYPLSSAKRLIFICSTSLFHSIIVRSFPLCFRNFFDSFGADNSGWSQPREFGRPLCLLHTLCVHRSVGQGL